MVSAKEINEIAKRIIAQNYDFDYVGIRVQESAHGIETGSEMEHVSRHWDDGEMTDEEIDGICAIDAQSAAKRVLNFGAYMGRTVIVLGSNLAYYGDDDGELILRDSPTVLEVIQL